MFFSFSSMCVLRAFCGRKLGSVLIQESCVEQQHSRKRYVLKHLSYDRKQVRNKINNVEREAVLQCYRAYPGTVEGIENNP